MRIYSCIILLLLLTACSSAPKKRMDKLSILQGITSAKEVEFSILGPIEKEFNFELRSAEGEVLVPDEVKVITRPFSPWKIHKVVFSREQTKEYNLYVYENKKVIDQRLIGRGQLNESRLKLAVVSCMNDGFEKEFNIWNTLAQKNPEYLLMIGDNVYANREPRGK